MYSLFILPSQLYEVISKFPGKKKKDTPGIMILQGQMTKLRECGNVKMLQIRAKPSRGTFNPSEVHLEPIIVTMETFTMYS